MTTIILCVIIDIFVFIFIGSIAYRKGCDKGYDDGYIQGCTIGRADGFEKGKKVGYDEGLERGRKQGLDEGFEDGKRYAAIQGHNERVLKDMGMLPDNYKEQ